MKIINDIGLPQAIISALENDVYEPGECDISVTQLIDPPQKVELTRHHSGEMEQNASGMLYALMGQAMHTILERAEDHASQEERLYADFGGWRIGGKYDRCNIEGGKLQDYKFCSVWEWIYGVNQERVAQVNVLRWLAMENGITINKLEIVMLFRDWSKSKAKYDSSYPQTQMAIVPVEIWDSEKLIEYISDRVRIHQLARTGVYPPCSEEDRWAKPSVYAVMKGQNKRAVKLYDNPGEASAHAMKDKAFHVQHRPGENVRCEHYCAAADFCPQFQSLKNA